MELVKEPSTIDTFSCGQHRNPHVHMATQLSGCRPYLVYGTHDVAVHVRLMYCLFGLVVPPVLHLYVAVQDTAKPYPPSLSGFR
jgi:hypothetical protein